MDILDFKAKFEELFKKRVVLYGAGITGVETYKTFNRYFKGVNVACFCDTFKVGSLCGIPIITPQKLEEMCTKESFIIVATALSSNHEDIIRNLQLLNLSSSQIYTFSQLEKIIIQNINDPRIDKWYSNMKYYKGRLPNDNKRNLYLQWWCPEHYCKNDILVYQPGKVGSVTICNSLLASGISTTHFHMLTDSFIYDLIPEMAWKPTNEEYDIINKVSHLCINKIKESKNIKIITLVREPLSRDYSLFFYHLNELKKNGCISNEKTLEEICIEGMMKRATQNGKCKYGYEFEWFNSELKKVFGIDVYNNEFDRETGYSIIKQNNIEVLILKLEKLNNLKCVLQEFTNAQNLNLIDANRSSQKGYKDLYKNMRKSIQLPQSIISMYYDKNPLMDHFYSEREKALFLKEWQHDITD